MSNRLATMSGGTTQGLVYDPGLNDHLPQRNWTTIFEKLDNAGVSWKIYYTNLDPNDPFPATTFGNFTYSNKYMSSGCGGARLVKLFAAEFCRTEDLPGHAGEDAGVCGSRTVFTNDS